MQKQFAFKVKLDVNQLCKPADPQRDRDAALSKPRELLCGEFGQHCRSMRRLFKLQRLRCKSVEQLGESLKQLRDWCELLSG
jgi:hypothetical protein